jgi:hypothetical protein
MDMLRDDAHKRQTESLRKKSLANVVVFIQILQTDQDYVIPFRQYFKNELFRASLFFAP